MGSTLKRYQNITARQDTEMVARTYLLARIPRLHPQLLNGLGQWTSSLKVFLLAIVAQDRHFQRGATPDPRRRSVGGAAVDRESFDGTLEDGHEE